MGNLQCNMDNLQCNMDNLQCNMDNPEKTKKKQNKNTTQYVLVITKRKQTRTTQTRHEPSYKQTRTTQTRHEPSYKQL